jgi:hypothetical protein
MSLSVAVPAISQGKPFVQRLIQLLELAGDDLEKAAEFGVCWVGGSSNRFFSNTTIIAKVLVSKQNSVCAYFRAFGIEKEKGATIPNCLRQTRQWKVRYHWALVPGVDESVGAQFKWKAPMKKDVPPEWKETEQRVFPGPPQSPVSMWPEDLDAFEASVMIDDDREMDFGDLDD